MKQFIQLSNEDIDTALSHDLREEVRRCNKHITAMQARIKVLEKVRKAAQSHMDFHGKDRGVSKTNDTLLDALFEARE